MSLPTSFPMPIANGQKIEVPSVGFGTWIPDKTTNAEEAILTALQSGYRHIDSAWAYNSSKPVGNAIRASGIPRSEIFVTSKAWLHFSTPEHVELALDKVLHDSGLECVDLFLAHHPVVFKPQSREALEKAEPNAYDQGSMGVMVNDKGLPVPDWQHTPKHVAAKNGHEGSFVPTWQAMQELVRKGKARAVGVSNFCIKDLEELLPYSKEIPISCNQVEMHPWLPNNELMAFHKKHAILTTAYAPFGGASVTGVRLIDDPKIQRLAKDSGMDIGQMLQSWAVQRGTIPLGKSATPDRIRSNLAVKRLPDEIFDALSRMEVPDEKGRLYDISPFFGVQFLA